MNFVWDAVIAEDTYLPGLEPRPYRIIRTAPLWYAAYPPESCRVFARVLQALNHDSLHVGCIDAITRNGTIERLFSFMERNADEAQTAIENFILQGGWAVLVAALADEYAKAGGPYRAQKA